MKSRLAAAAALLLALALTGGVSAQRPPEEKPAEQPEKAAPADKPAEKPSEGPVDKPAEKPAEEPGETPTERPDETPAEAPEEKPDDTAGDEPAEKPEGEPDEEAGEKPAAKPDDKTPPAKGGVAPKAAKVGLRDRLAIGVSGGYFDMLGAHDSAVAVFGSGGGFTFGGDASYLLGKKRRFSVTLGVRVFQKDGERVFVASPGGAVFKLGHPLEVRLVPIEVTLGYRFERKKVLGVRITPYVGAGPGFTSYRETSTVGGLSEKESLTKTGVHGLLGLELGDKQVRFAVEAGYSAVPSAIGVGGVSKVYGESDIGGFRLLGRIAFGSAKR